MAQLRTEYKRKNKKRPNKFLRVSLFTLLGVLLLTGSVAAYMIIQAANAVSSAQTDLERGDRSDFRENIVQPGSDPISVLFLGLDSRDGDLRGRTDAMVLATFNPEDKSIKILNIPRDSRVEIVGRPGLDKINHAHAFGGLDMTIDTVENLLDIPVDYFVSLNFDAFMKVIDELGGVEVDVPFTFTEKDNQTYGTITLHEGVQTLNGEEALAYVRMRKSDPRGDLGRGDRQKEVIEAIIKKTASFSSITRFNPIMDSLEGNLKTNITFNNILSMHTFATDLGDIESLSFEGDNLTEGGVYFYELRPESVREISQRLQVHLNIIEAVDAEFEVETDEVEAETEQ
ncbi:LCP family protein [Evansella cellulosilytica]|uniref:Cell envelope-related transcriptional attenuator n=1 Tax=Evansella cellulosilytica (strain ATCC 21833 / DSM 2522 / FERM P-1141 / JCM 9156 / N-4) TaxID=649639 RepID=E6TSA8_EVAC2|nr:LCP family protein [Evansella cellulosilytica]ADU31877.1 cell envelope-related transcriptional attenuator [Evansella cellulosilytica DSM 2522]